MLVDHNWEKPVKDEAFSILCCNEKLLMTVHNTKTVLWLEASKQKQQMQTLWIGAIHFGH